MDHRIPLSSINVGASTSSAPPSISQRSTAPLQGTPRSTPSALSGLCCLSRSSSTETNGSIAEETHGQSIGQSVLSGVHSCITSCLPSLGPNLSNLTPEQRSKYYCNLAADYARRSAECDSNGDPLHKKENEELTSKGNVCWDAVKDCAFKAGAIPKNRYKSVNAKTDLVTSSDTRINNANELRNVPPGHTLGFFEAVGKLTESPRIATKPFHVMLTTGDNKAAGHKNGCIEIGNPSGWEELDLSQLKWHEGYFIASSEAKGKEIDLSRLREQNGHFVLKEPNKKGVYYKAFVVTHRPISEAGKQPSNEASTSAQV
ncbi:hypothetical protein SAMN04487769_0427 [Burkholderia sp. b14]|nr:hypothetical protein [Mycetohabitans sp. B7]SIT65147.1 hypothetical protein SAMN04487769_0427 [Burkholderia sp. b14]